MEIVEEEARCLSAGIVNAVNILEIEAVVLTGDICYKHGIIIDSLSRHVNERVMMRKVHRVGLYASEIAKNADVIAAATIVIDDFIH